MSDGIEAVAKVLLLNEKDEILVLRRSEYPAHPEQSHQPDLPGGIVDPGESERRTVVREIQEETGIEIDPDDLKLAFAKTIFHEGGHSRTRLLYAAKLDNTPPVILSWEHEGYVWCPKQDVLAQYHLPPFYAEGLAYLLEHELI